MKSLKKYFFLIILLFLASLNFNIILKQIKLVAGGTQGLAVILNHLFDISPSTIILIINILMLIISYFTLEKETTYGIILSTFIYPLLVRLTSNININLGNYTVLFVILAGIICGITSGFIYKLGFSTGGISVISVIIKKYFKIKISISNLVINFVIILVGSFYFGVLKGLYSSLIVLISSFIIYEIMKMKKITKY